MLMNHLHNKYLLTRSQDSIDRINNNIFTWRRINKLESLWIPVNVTDSLQLPGIQQQLLEQVIATCTPAVLVMFGRRPYHLAGLEDKRVGCAPFR
ncbi:conserved hypothetical protein [Enterobacterales bacterium 8AC]|nr:conserved hypothetical protein [Enterobacterales bacterium 8AC]